MISICWCRSVIKTPLQTLLVASALFASSQSSALQPSERLLAGELADAQVWQFTRSAGSHELGVQTLSVEVDERKKGDRRRRARVYQFNYDSQQSRLVVVDLQQRTIDKILPIDTVHLPLNPLEIELARNLVESEKVIMALLNDNQRQRGLPQLNDLSTIEVKASIFEPDDASHQCAMERCALISLFDQTRTVFAVEPLVNLQRLYVTTLQPRF